MSEPINITADGKVTKVILREGTGEQAKEGDKVKVHYVGTLESDGSKFDSSRDRNSPFEFTIGQGVITGWSLGVATMKVGELSRFTIGSDYGYGDSGSPPKIPGGATLIFEIELLSIKKGFKNNDEAIAYASELSNSCIGLFKEGKFKEAIEKYHEAYEAVADVYAKEAKDLKVKLNNNLAVCHLKVNEFGEALHHAEDALRDDAKNLKATVSKIQAQISLGQLEKAGEAIEKGIHDIGSSPQFVALQKKLKEAEKKARESENALFAKMFGK